ncbi:hypothetical protein [Nocardia sp. NPDC019395]|uniref:DUF7373 family lipoprotein n=1 Tax=Nocardia sp. NPDC019395 TaxID=3154686 RepID=UPI0033D174DC
MTIRTRPWVAGRALPVLIATASMILTAACGATVTGAPTPGMTPVALDGLDVGLLATEPKKFELNISTHWDVYSLESRRMFEYLVSPHQVDPDFKYLDKSELMVAGGNAGALLPAEFGPILEKNYLVSGVITARGNNRPREGRQMITGLMRFGNEEYARAAAEQFGATADTISPGRLPVQLTGHNDAHAAITSSRDRAQVFVAMGSYVVIGLIATPPDRSAQLEPLMTAFLDLQSSAISDLTPTPPDDILDQPLDPGGLMRKTLQSESPPPAAHGGLVGVYPAAGHIHFEYDAEALPDYSRFGVDSVARHETIVYRTGSLSQAFALQTVLSRPGKYDEKIAQPPGIADAQCVMRDTTTTMFDSHVCVLVYDRYVAVIGGSGMSTLADPELYQRAAAQYTLLANSR